MSNSVVPSALVRPARKNDLPSLLKLLEHVDPGMITMPQNEAAMALRLERSLDAFAQTLGSPNGEAYFLVMEEDGRIIGTSSIFTSLGKHRPFYSYRIMRQSKTSPETGVSVELDILHLVNDHHGDTELGTLFLLPDFRGGGRGKLLSFARLMLIAAAPQRFGHRVMAEIRGWTDDDGSSPFWDGVGRKFFKMGYRKADEMSVRDHRFIADLMPRFPIYADLLSEAATEVIAKPHPAAQPAMGLLKGQGFHYANVVDIFDAGPCVECFTDSIATVRDSRRMTAGEWITAEIGSSGLVANADFNRFCVARFDANDAREQICQRIGADELDELIIYRP